VITIVVGGLQVYFETIVIKMINMTCIQYPLTGLLGSSIIVGTMKE